MYVRYWLCSVTAKPSFASSRSALFLTNHQWVVYRCGGPQCQPMHHLLPTCTCAASRVPTAQGLCYHTRLICLYTVPLCLSQKYLILHRTGGTKGVRAFRCWVWRSSGIYVSCASPVLLKHFCLSEWPHPASQFHKAPAGPEQSTLILSQLSPEAQPRKLPCQSSHVS